MGNQKSLLYLNGLDATTGHLLAAPTTYEELMQQVLKIFAPEQRREEQESYRMERFAPFDEYKLDDPALAGWGLLVHAEEAEIMQERLASLIAHRQGRVLLYRDEPICEWKEKNCADTINPDRFPFYILIAGNPTRIPFELQFSLAVLHAVGRIDFDDPNDYVRYAKEVVDRENELTPTLGKRAVFFAPRHPGDYPTSQSSQRLVRPLLDQLPASVSADIKFDALIGYAATKDRLIASLGADESGQTPAFLFSAGHGAAVASADFSQRTLQGSIVCQDCEFPLTPQRRQGFISGYDVSEGFSLPGGILFLFACYGAGTRAHSDFVRFMPTETGRQQLKATQGKEDFVASLPKALLANPKGGAAAVVGHVDPAWVHSFIGPITKERRIDPFGFTIARILRNNPVGFAVTAFNQRYSDLSVDLLSLIEDKEETGQLPDSLNFSDLWVCRNDAQNYVIVGDPAVHLRF